MSWTCHGSNNEELVEALKGAGLVQHEAAIEAMNAVDRGLFCPDKQKSYRDAPQPIGYNATISAPHMHATCLEILKDNLLPGNKVLDVGSGSGYLTAIFAAMVCPATVGAAQSPVNTPATSTSRDSNSASAPSAETGVEGSAEAQLEGGASSAGGNGGGGVGMVVGVEHIPELVKLATAAAEALPFARALLRDRRLQFIQGDGMQGWREGAPYDAIHVGASAKTVPGALVEQLAKGGRMVLPVGGVGEAQVLRVIDRDSQGNLKEKDVLGVQYVPLTSKEAQLARIGVPTFPR